MAVREPRSLTAGGGRRVGVRPLRAAEGRRGWGYVVVAYLSGTFLFDVWSFGGYVWVWWPFLLGEYIVSRLPSSRRERLGLVLEDSLEYVRRMGSVDVDRLLLSLSKTDGLSVDEIREGRAARWNVAPEFVPDYLEKDH